MNHFDMTEEFHHIFDPTIPNEPTAFDSKKTLDRAAFKIEEIVEFTYSVSDNNPATFDQAIDSLHAAIDTAKAKILSKEHIVTDPLIDQVDALSDLLYFTYGSFSLLGVNPGPIMNIIHKANMGKLFPDGQPHYHPVTHKVLKPDNWEQDFAPEAKIKEEIQRQRAEGKHSSSL